MKHYGLIGQSLGHSFSQRFFNQFFAEKGIDADYVNIELAAISEVEAVLQKGFSGLNVTVPYKTAIIPYLDELTPEAAAIGAVNVVRFVDGKCVGHNTDAFGFHQSIKPFLTNQHERAIIFGTGGASKAVAYVLRKIGVEVLFVSRNPKHEHEFAYEEVNEWMLKACKLLVNTTPVGMFPNSDECLQIPFNELTPDHLVVDLIYNPAVTQFLKKASVAGAVTLNGESMLKEQALGAWKCWKEDESA